MKTLSAPHSYPAHDGRDAGSLSTWSFNWRMISYHPWSFALHSFFTVLVFGLQVVPGLIVKSVFDLITVAEPAPGIQAFPIALWGLIGLYLLAGLSRLFFSLGSEWYGWTFRSMVAALLHRNIFASILRRSGEHSLPVSSGEAINRLHTDVGEVADFPTWLPDQFGKILAALVAIVIMARINLTITLFIFIPLVATLLLTRLAWGRILRYNRASGKAADNVTGFLGEIFDAVQAVKTANAETAVVKHFHRLNEVRRTAAVRENLFHGLLEAVNSSTVTFGIGVMLLLAGQAITAGTFTVGDFALFVSYLWFTTQVPSELGVFIGDYKTQEVSIERMLDLVTPEPPRVLVEHHPVYAQGEIPTAPFVPKTPGDSLEYLAVRNLTYHHNQNGHGIEGVDLDILSGSFTVITGRIGSGKSTLVRVLLGLLTKEAGEIYWNGRLVSDPASFFRPPRVAYTSQVPRLFSDTLRENILLGLPEAQVDLAAAIRLGVMEKDVAALENGLDTYVGPRGVRLSGGQVQRAAAARMFVRNAELLVFDDLSSALDVETESILWQRLSERQDFTCLVISNRRAALRRANNIVVMKAGKVDAQGKLPELLDKNVEMRRLWEGEPDSSLDEQNQRIL